MKKLILLSALTLSGAMMANADEVTLTKQWSMNCPLAAASARAGVGTNGKFYLIQQNYGVHVYDKTGEVKTIANSSAWVSINCDDAGHVYFRNDKSGWAGPAGDGSYTKSNAQFCVYDAVADEMIAENVPMVGAFDGCRFDVLPHVRGNMATSPFNFVVPISQTRTMYEFAFENFKDACKSYYSEAPIAYFSEGDLKTPSSTTGITQQYDDNHLAAVFNPSTSEYYGNGKANTIGIFEKTAAGSYTFKGYADTPNHSGVGGFHIFDYAGKQYIVYPTGQSAGQNASADGFAVMELAIVASPANTESTPLALHYAEIEVGETWPRYFNVEPVEGQDGRFSIYLYSPGKIMSVFTLDFPGASGGEEPGIDPVPDPNPDPDPDAIYTYEFNTTWRTDMRTTDKSLMRQGVGVNGKMYITNCQYLAWDHNRPGWVEVWDENGFVENIYAENGGDISGTNITCDDAGNILVRKSFFPNDFVGGNFDAIIIDPEGQQTAITFDSNRFNNDMGISNGRQDFWGHVKGNMLSDEGGCFTFGTSNSGHTDIKIVNGVHVGAETSRDSYWADANLPHTTTAIFNSYSWMQDQALYQAGPNAPINFVSREPINGTYKWFVRGEYYTPDHNKTVGCALFQLDGVTYIVYSRGSNNADGIVIAKARLTGNKAAVRAAAEEEDPDIIIKTFAELEDDVTKYNGQQYNHFNVEVLEDGHTAHIYQYCPGNFAAMHTFKATKDLSGINDIASENEESNVAPVYYNLQGVRVVNPHHGIFIEVRGNKTSKVIK